jgi:ATP-dependent helicase/nuclease subunit A
MSAETLIPIAQRHAADPAHSAWVAASAGTGKTKVLIDRLLNLLVGGTAPQRLLCLTFTKAAAKEMTLRLAGRLEEWVAASDADLDAELERLSGHAPDANRRAAARRLFARVIDAPGGLRIDTIHAFCQSLLRRFPVEAGLPPTFQVLEERSAAELMNDARDTLLAAASTDPDLGRSLMIVTARIGELAFNEAMATLVAERSRLLALLTRHGGVDGLERATRAALGVPPAATPEAILADACDDRSFDAAGAQRAAKALLQGSTQDRKFGKLIAAWLADVPGRMAGFQDYRFVYFTDDGERRKRIATKATLKANPWIEGVLAAEADRVEAAEMARRSASLVVTTSALVRLGKRILDEYDTAKLKRGALDYDDLINRTRDLLHGPGVADWVLFKLDGGIDHILVDEAQDTNPEQWQVIQALAEEFFAGEGASERDRTVFAVGDAKQSIFSFQRADPTAFARMREHFTQRVRAASKEFKPLELTLSFRSIPAVLQAVDAVIAPWPEEEWRDLGGNPLHHASYREKEGGRVELWPPVVPDAPDKIPTWDPPAERETATPPPARLARMIAATIRGWLDRGDPLESQGRPIQPGDILILVRRRNSFVEDLVRALKKDKIAIAGVDRMVLTDQLAIMDLVALGRFLLLPRDDLTLAAVLKGPLFGLSEEALFDLAYNRTGSLWAALRARAKTEPLYDAAFRELSALLDRADYVAPYELYADILAARRGRARLLARLGDEADDPIDEFLAAALAYERDHPPSLEGFLHWLERGAQEIKRDADVESRAVRIMTVHGAKGLQAPIVFLPDTMQTPREHKTLLWGEDLVLWSQRKADDDEYAHRLRETAGMASDAEHRRLLYVAMTRASDRLYVCGYRGVNNAPALCWYNHVSGAVAELGTAFDFSDPVDGASLGAGRRIDWPQTKPVAAATPAGQAGREAAVPPVWWRRPAPPEPEPPRPLTPSAPDGAEPPVRSPLGRDDGARFKRGRLVHHLLQILPEVEPARRAPPPAPDQMRRAHRLTADAVRTIATETLAVLDHPDFAPLFGPGSVAEVAVVGRVGNRVISGQIDRLVVTGGEVLIVDFKTNRPPPQRAEDVPAVYRAQMAAYRNALAPIYPGKQIRTALLWTDGPSLLWLPG